MAIVSPPAEKSLHPGTLATAVARAAAVFPAGGNGEFNLPPTHSLVVDRAQGYRLWDSEATEYLDFSMGWGSVLVGHSREEVVQAVSSRASLGTNFSYTNTESLRLAEELVRLSPCCELVRFCASGTEATSYCLRLARAFTGRAMVLKFEGAYHGSNDEGVTSLFPSGNSPFPHPEPSSHGVDATRTLIAPFNNLAATTAILHEHARSLAAVIVEPFHRCLSPMRGFLEGLRAECTAAGVPLIFDEVVTGFRLAYGGAQQRYGVVPDLVAYGKALGGGLPIGAFGGRAEIMNLVREERLGNNTYVWTASTLGGNPLSCAAANAALSIFRMPGTYERLYGMGEYFRDGLRRVLFDSHQPGQVIGDGPLAQVVLSPSPVTDYRSMQAADKRLAREMMLGLVRERIFINPMGTKLYLSLAHSHEACDEFCDRLSRVLRALA
ncbi:MAG: aminotransferase class III-fold pyridoxal phosphate-dependent enzyme [Phycisphaeraceae bacterium]|nr:aminotransferase class III-fold pyridoxal phosphate-dependent enzyme [Phycisphaeraceae bacterium]